MALCVSALLVSPKVQAQEVKISGPLAGAPAVMKLRLYRESRFQIKAMTAMTLQDEFTRALLFGGQLTYHITDWLGIGVWGGAAPVQIDTSLTDQIADKGQSNERNVLSLPRKDRFPDQIGKMTFVAAPQVIFIPLRGKLGLFEKLFVDTDFFVFAGVAAVGVEERADVPAGVCSMPVSPSCEATQSERESRVAVAPTFGVGLSLYVADFLSIPIEWRALPFSWNTSGTDESGDSHGDFPDGEIDSDDRLFLFNHMVSLGVAFYLPMEPTLTHATVEEE
jgi:outer membrane beta-barrel protein